MKITKHNVANICVNILNSKVIVILTDYIDRESNGGDALLLVFLFHRLLTAGCIFIV